MRFQNYGWYLSGVEDGDETVKHFAVGRMSETSLRKPGTARPVPEVGKIPLHPLLWAVAPPTQVTVRTTPEFVAESSGGSASPTRRPSVATRWT